MCNIPVHGITVLRVHKKLLHCVLKAQENTSMECPRKKVMMLKVATAREIIQQAKGTVKLTKLC